MFERTARRMRRRAPLPALTAAFLWTGVLGCDAASKPESEPVELKKVEIAAGRMTLGLATGTLRREVELPGFAISQHPTTRGEYGACAEAGACPELECSSFGGLRAEDAEALPMDCAGVADASRFCAWVGGSLPRLGQWLRAARGPSPRRFAWGDERPTCEQHPLAGMALSAFSGVPEARFGRGVSRCRRPMQDYAVGQHPAVKSDDGMQDVLLTPSELVRGTPVSPFGACRSEAAGCVVYGLEAAAIDSVSDSGSGGSSARGVGFRCAWEK